MSDLLARATEIRRIAVSLIDGAGSGHPGSCLSAADLIAALYFGELRDGVDKFVLSKGHACPALYAALHLRGFYDRAALGSFRRLGGMLQGSPTTHIPGIDATCGSLGQGFSIAVGMALGYRVSDTARIPTARAMNLAKTEVSDTDTARSAAPATTGVAETAVSDTTPRIHVMLGDGELQEGQIWEGAMAAGHYRLSNLCAIVDYNKMQSDDLNEHIMRLEPLDAKWRAFNWHVRAIDGHRFDEIAAAFAEARATHDKPTLILAHTIKGKGVSYMEGVPSWHGSVTLKPEEIRRALADLGVPPQRQSEYAFHG
jgi:transketolase